MDSEFWSMNSDFKIMNSEFWIMNSEFWIHNSDPSTEICDPSTEMRQGGPAASGTSTGATLSKCGEEPLSHPTPPPHRRYPDSGSHTGRVFLYEFIISLIILIDFDVF